MNAIAQVFAELRDRAIDTADRIADPSRDGFACALALVAEPTVPTTKPDGRGQLRDDGVAFSHVANTVTFALVGGTGGYAGVEGQVTGAPATVGGRAASHLTFELAKK